MKFALGRLLTLHRSSRAARTFLFMLFVTAISLVSINQADAVISYSLRDSIYSQDFDSLASSGYNVSWTNDSTLPGWSLYDKNGAAKSTYNADNGINNVSTFVSYGSSLLFPQDRALGSVLGSNTTYFASPSSGNIAGWTAVAIRNDTLQTQDTFSLRFNGEQWRDSSYATQDMVLQYGFGGSTMGSVGTWNTPGGNFDWTSPIHLNLGAVNGNILGLQANRGGTFTGMNWINGQTLWVRWIERNDPGNDHGMAIDDFMFSTEDLFSDEFLAGQGGGAPAAMSISVVPEPSTFGVAAMMIGFGLAMRRKLRNRTINS